MIIGLTGTFGAGKDLAAQYLEQKGFEHYSTADVLREEARKEGLNTERETLRVFVNKLRQEKGDDYLAKEATKRFKGDKIAVSALRSIGEIDYFKKRSDFTLIFVDAPIEIRYERIKDRARAGEEKISFEEFKEKEELEMSGQSSQRLDYSKERADYIIENAGAPEELYKKLDQIINY